MKLNIELKEGEFKFEYDLGENTRGTTTMPWSMRSLKLFVELCEYANSSRNQYYKDKIQEISLRAFVETDLDLVKEWVKNEDLKRKK